MNLTLPKPSEHEIQNAIIELLQRQGFVVWRNNSGAKKYEYTDKQGKTRKHWARFGGIPGASDIFALKPPHAQFIAIEVKRDAKQKPTPQQEAFLETINRVGGIGFVAWSVDKVAEELDIKGLF